MHSKCNKEIIRYCAYCTYSLVSHCSLLFQHILLIYGGHLVSGLLLLAGTLLTLFSVAVVFRFSMPSIFLLVFLLSILISFLYHLPYLPPYSLNVSLSLSLCTKTCSTSSSRYMEQYRTPVFHT